MKKPISFTDAEIEQVRNDHGPLGAHFKLDEQKGCKITQRKDQGEWVDGSPPIGEVCEQEIIPGKWVPATVLFRNDLGCVIDTPYRTMDDNLRRTGSQSYYSCLVKLNFRPILTPKQRTIEAAYAVTCETIGNPDTVANSEYRTTLLNALFEANCLILPGEEKAEIERLKAKVDDQQQHINGMIHGGDCK